jgi:glycosyltransferase involved in cell wall biosynthesis
MELALIVTSAIAVAELFIWLPGAWRLRKPLAILVTIALGAASGQLLVVHLAVWTALIVFLNLYRIVNLLRLVEGRTASDYLYRVARTSSWCLIGLQLGTGTLAWLDGRYQPSAVLLWYVLAGIELLFALIVTLSTIRHLRTTRPPKLIGGYADRDLPSLTVAIPARNETEDLEKCLQSLLTSTYPKLEILVLDDCSQNKRTPEIIRAFAHDGVRFIAGETVPDSWLAKNYAYQQLSAEANGKLILFCGVDTRFTPDTLEVLVETLLQKKKQMFSVLPRNEPPTSRLALEQLLVQPSRYAWELALPRRWLNRPPVLSTCWLITSTALHAAGGFKAVARSSSPESYFARAVAIDDGYSFLCSDERIGLSCIKSLPEQRATAVRTRYPQLHRRPEIAAGLTLTELAVLILPFIIFIVAVIARLWPLAAVSFGTCLLLTVHYSKIVNLTYRSFLLRGLWLLPFAAAYDLFLLNYSMWQYEFNEVRWKDRNVCLPLMRVTPHLPKLQ